MSTYTPEQVSKLVDGKLDWDTTLRMLSMPKDPERFSLYLQALQARRPWSDRIVLPLGPHLHVVQQTQSKRWVIQCDCGHVFCDWNENWKLHANLYVRETEAAMTEVYPRLMAPDTAWQVYREYSCQQCGTLHDVEAPTPWYPVIHDFEPDIDAFYKEWVKLPLPERSN
ncbi:acetone carboxylase subunit gamma [Rubrivivax gelatinosus]|uniref:Acetone carboxylase subunit gamma n=1 Tax=Rubrivivax gelatinosus TaxID=28068 RepID=A0ABS1DTD2_RUBGE|nr:acetone carboxylase subunit gamma [Rubrivivax gelatinosus]MBK1613641.1 acetone carboxylase subunit gamma [Rubrivivax gelatinosus]MBK1713274.1 acetone carboxylase subunit gamma [Rubrivivax gelatinosus]